MVRRFQIEDMVTQDASGVVFRALDTETNQPVAVRRFFPFGVNGGGLSGDEQADYNIAVGRLAGISHPAMRSIIAGGCDPVDGMPFIATEWIEGAPLQTYIERCPLSPAEAAHMLTQALEVCEQISRVFGEEAVWVETDVHTIIVGTEESGRGITFWISPLKWLGKNDGQRGLDSIVSLAEDVMGWRGKIIQNHEGGGLGGWLKWLRGAAMKTSLPEARQMLKGVAGAASSAPGGRAVPRSVPMPGKRKSGVLFFVWGFITLAAISIGGWALIQWNNSGVLPFSRERPPARAIPDMEKPVSEPPPSKEPQPRTGKNSSSVEEVK